MTQAWPKGKMIEGRSGGSGRGTRRELWAPPDSGSAQPADRTLYRVPTLDPRRPLISFPPPLPHPRTCLLATGKNSAAPERTFSSALVSAEWRAQRENDRREERGSEAEKEAGLLVQQLRSVIQEIANALLKNRSLNFADVERIYGPNNYKPAPDRFID